MSKLYISEFATMAKVRGDAFTIAAPQEPCIVDQAPIAISGSHAESQPFNDGTRVVRVHTDAICSIAFGANPVATTDNKRLAAGATEYFGVAAGHILSVIANT